MSNFEKVLLRDQLKIWNKVHINALISIEFVISLNALEQILYIFFHEYSGLLIIKNTCLTNKWSPKYIAMDIIVFTTQRKQCYFYKSDLNWPRSFSLQESTVIVLFLFFLLIFIHFKIPNSCRSRISLWRIRYTYSCAFDYVQSVVL